MFLWLIVFLALGLWTFIINYVNRRKMPPGPIKLPILGNILQIQRADKHTGPAYLKLAKEYGDIMSLQCGSQDSVILSSYESIRDLFALDDISDRHLEGPGLDRNMNREMGIIFASGQVWKELRRFTVRNLRDFGFGKSHSMETAQVEELDHFVKYLTKEIRQSFKNGSINMDGLFNLTTLNISWRLIMGQRFSYDDPKILHYMKLNDEFFRSNDFISSWSIVFPFLRYWFPKQSGRTALLKSVGALHAYIRSVIDECRSTENYKNEPQNFVDVFLAKIYSERNVKETPFTDDQLAITMLDIFQAGAETTSGTLGFGVLFLILHPEVQKKLQDEIDSYFPNQVTPTLEAKPRMIYTQAVLLEIHRYAVIIPVPIAHKAIRDVHYKGYTFKAGTPIFPNLYGLFMNENIWGDPENFRPERFITLEGKLDKGKATLIIPFALGKRVCPGEAIAETTIFMYLVTLLQHFTFSKVPGAPDPSLEPQVGFASCPKPYDAIIKTRF